MLNVKTRMSFTPASPITIHGNIFLYGLTGRKKPEETDREEETEISDFSIVLKTRCLQIPAAGSKDKVRVLCHERFRP